MLERLPTYTMGDGRKALVLDGKNTLYSQDVLEYAIGKGEWALLERPQIQGAIKALTELQDGEAVAALNHPEVGDIDLVWGKTSDNERARGFGLSKIAKWHPEVLSDLQGFISGLKVKQRHNNKLQLQSEDGSRASVQLDWDGKRKTWLLTAYEKDVAGSNTSADTAANAVGGDTARPNSNHALSVPPAAPEVKESRGSKAPDSV